MDAVDQTGVENLAARLYVVLWVPTGVDLVSSSTPSTPVH